MKKFHIRKDEVFNCELSVWISFLHGDNRSIAEPLCLKEVPEGIHSTPAPTFSIMPNEAQQLMDALWDCGLRPSEGSGSAGAMKATQNHLQDMRKLVFKDERSI